MLFSSQLFFYPQDLRKLDKFTFCCCFPWRKELLFLIMMNSLFGFFPIFRQSLRGYNRNLSDLLAVCMSLMNFTLILNLSQLHAFGFLFCIVFITMISPILFIYAYQFKNDIQGPWDLPDVIQYTSID